VITQGIGHLVMADSHGNGQIHICGLHVIFLSLLGNIKERKPSPCFTLQTR